MKISENNRAVAEARVTAIAIQRGQAASMPSEAAAPSPAPSPVTPIATSDTRAAVTPLQVETVTQPQGQIEQVIEFVKRRVLVLFDAGSTGQRLPR